MALAGFNTNLNVTGASQSMSNEDCTVISGTSNQDWEISDAAKDVWDWGTAMTVEVTEGSGYSALNTDEYTLRWLIGVVQIDNLNSGTVTSNDATNITDVRVSGAYYPTHTVLEGRSGGFTIEPEMLDATQLGDEAQRRIRGTTDISPSFEQLQVPETPIDGSGGSESSIEDYAEGGTTFVYAFNEGSATKSKQRAVVKISDLGLEGPQDDIQAESLELMVNTESSTMSDQPDADWDIWDY